MDNLRPYQVHFLAALGKAATVIGHQVLQGGGGEASVEELMESISYSEPVNTLSITQT